MKSLSELQTHDPAKAEVLGFIFDALNHDLETQSWDEEKIREIVSDLLTGRVYDGCSNLSNDDLKHLYESQYWRQLEHMTIAEYCADATKLYEWEQIETKYWQELTRVVLESKANEAIGQITEQLKEFYDYLADLENKGKDENFWGDSDYKETFDAGDYKLFHVSSECPHGWQSHSDEKHAGEIYVYRWMHGQVEGLNAISLSLFGGQIWATLTIDPKDGRHFGREWF